MKLELHSFLLGPSKSGFRRPGLLSAGPQLPAPAAATARQRGGGSRASGGDADLRTERPGEAERSEAKR